MFQRRDKPKLHHRARDFLWPSLGWKRSTAYLFHRVARLPGSSYSIAAGFACGAAISFTPFVGMHFILGALIAWAVRGNIIASAIGTAIGNPWTFPFIWAWVYNMGLWMGAGGHQVGVHTLDFSAIFSASMDALLEFDVVFLMETAGPVLWPMFIGGIPSFIVVWMLAYFPSRPLIEAYQNRRLERRMRNSMENDRMDIE
ncbi:MAG: DUF2062 domain-containing protein [Alphaproteobacteria bacterium]